MRAGRLWKNNSCLSSSDYSLRYLPSNLTLLVQAAEGVPGVSMAVEDCTLPYWAPYGRPWGRLFDCCWFGESAACLCQLIYWTSCHLSKIQKGIASARSNNTKSLKGVVLDWITPRNKALDPPLSRNVKTNRGYNHLVTGALLYPAGFNWNDAE